MKRLAEVAVAILVPPLATILAWRDVVLRRDLPGPLRGWWAVVCLVPAIGPILYLGVGKGRFW